MITKKKKDFLWSFLKVIKLYNIKKVIFDMLYLRDMKNSKKKIFKI